MPNGIDIFRLIFEQILQIDASTIARYTTTQDQLLYLLLIPHVVVFLFIYAFSKGIVGRIAGEHRGFVYLVGIVAYIFIILSGWYGGMLIPFVIGWWQIAIVVALVVFLASVVIHPARTPMIGKMFSEVGKEIGKRTVGRRSEAKAIKDQLRIIRSQINAYESQLKHRLTAGTPEYQYAMMNLQELKRQEAELRGKLRVL